MKLPILCRVLAAGYIGTAVVLTPLTPTCIYILPQRTLNRPNEYLLEAADRYNADRFMEWLSKLEPVHGHMMATGATWAQ